MIGVRGAVHVQAEANEAEAIRAATRRVLEDLLERNAFQPSDIVSAFFTMTPDPDATFPAGALRDLGWCAAPMLEAQETPVPGAPPRIIRVVSHVEG